MGNDAARSGPPEWVVRLADELGPALAADLGSERFPAPGGWELGGVAPRYFREWVPVVTVRRGAENLCFIVTPTRPSEPAYKRTARHDVTYFSDDVADDAQDQIYQRDRPMIDAFVRWLSRRDGAQAR